MSRLRLAALCLLVCFQASILRGQPSILPPPAGYSPSYPGLAIEPLPPLDFGPPPMPRLPQPTTVHGPNELPGNVPAGSVPPGGPPPSDVPPEAVIVEEIFSGPELPIVLPKIWEGSVELGLNGTEGNSENFNFRFLVNAKRTTAANALSLNTRYINNSANSVETANRLFGEGRYEWLCKDSPWSIYVHSTTEYDEFRAFDVRLTGDAGLGYQFIKNDFLSLLGRAGPGFSHEIGGPDDSIVPEAVFGLAYEQRLTTKSKLSVSTDYYPDISEFGEFRLNNQVNWEICLDEMLHLSLKFSILDRYDSTPNGAKANDLDYSATILWSF